MPRSVLRAGCSCRCMQSSCGVPSSCTRTPFPPHLISSPSIKLESSFPQNLIIPYPLTKSAKKEKGDRIVPELFINCSTEGLEKDMKEALELRLGLPGTHEHDQLDQIQSHRKKICTHHSSYGNHHHHKKSSSSHDEKPGGVAQLQCPAPRPKAVQVVGWPPVGSFRKKNHSNTAGMMKAETEPDDAVKTFVKVSMDGAPFLRKIHLTSFTNYFHLLTSLQNMFNCTCITIDEAGCSSSNNGSGSGSGSAGKYAATYEDKDGDWMLVGDVPWHMFVSTCKRLRIMKGSQAKGSTTRYNH